MSIGLLIITHNQVGHTLLQTAINMMGICPLSTEVLVLTDMFGSTPSNIAYDLLDEGRINVVAGINLPMLVRVLNYAPLDLKELTSKAISGGKDGIVCCRKAETA
ncbi:PTS fructose transporter subunit IIA [bacterium endosymbiont of Escarpia laminata]|nr:MAG: PTS fructose transporter subunit IIA [bacterium endosymbiont of Escarpia laminata]